MHSSTPPSYASIGLSVLSDTSLPDRMHQTLYAHAHAVATSIMASSAPISSPVCCLLPVSGPSPVSLAVIGSSWPSACSAFVFQAPQPSCPRTSRFGERGCVWGPWVCSEMSKIGEGALSWGAQ